MMKNKSIIMLLLITLLGVFSLVGCGEDSNVTSGVNPNGSSSGLSGDLKVSFLDVGQGDSIFIELPNNETMLIDAGNPGDASFVIQYIRDAGYDNIKYIVGTHPHDDHTGGLTEIIETFDIGSIYMPKAANNTNSFENLLEAIANKGYKINTAKTGVNILNDGNLNIDIIAPAESSYNDLNDSSVVMKVDYGTTSFLFMGDAEKLSESQITADIDADVLKVGHHGSDYSTSPSFIDKVSPSYVVISVGEGNIFGHPSAEILRTLSSEGVITYRTDYDGTIVFTSDGAEITVYKSDSEKPDTSRIAPEEPDKSAANQQLNGRDDVTVYVSSTGSKYHNAGCDYLKSSNAMILSDAIAAGYTPCSRCNPPQ